MQGFLVDEDLPRNLASLLRSAGLKAHDVREVGLRGSRDSEVFAYAQTNDLCLVSGDLEFGNLLLFPLGTHHGIVIVRFPNEITVPVLNQAVLAAVGQFEPRETTGAPIVVEPGRVRFKQNPNPS